MRILTAEQVREWDRFTIETEPISSIDLMERAAIACVQWLEDNTGGLKKQFSVFCGKGNNGGDGLAIGRLLSGNGHRVTVHILEFGHFGSADFQFNLERLHQVNGVEIRFIQSVSNFPDLDSEQILVDAIIGTGLNRPLESVTAALIEHLNAAQREIVSIDIPSGMFADRSSKGNPIIHANHTLTFQCYKPAFLYAENAPLMGTVHVLDIGLADAFQSNSGMTWIDEQLARDLHKPRPAFAHKGNFGHALLLAGSHGKMGAAVLAGRACLAGGPGLLTICVPGSGYDIIQTAVPEAMAISTGEEFITEFDFDRNKYNSIGIGPGIGTEPGTAAALRSCIEKTGQPVVIDADGLNLLARNKELLKFLPPSSILTPHPKEFERLFGEAENDFRRTEIALEQAARLEVVIILKGHHTLVAMPGGQLYFNSTGNAGMAKGGSGDVLTGLLTGMLASGYTPDAAAILGVYLHGLAGDFAAENSAPETMTASDLVSYLPQAFRRVATPENTED